MKKRKTYSVLLTITNRCNLSCSYCYESMKDTRDMSLEVGKKIIIDSFKKIRKGDYDLIEFDFHGGEPFMNFNFIQKICEWTWSQEWPISYRFFGTTNGTLLSEKVKIWLSNNKDLICFALSMDGMPEMNKQNRGCTIPDDNLQFFQMNWPLQPIKMTISKETISNIGKGIIYAHEKGFKVSVNMAYGIDWDSSYLDVYKKELDILVEYYKENTDILPCSIFDKNLAPIYIERNNIRHCGAGRNMKTFDTEGRSFPCQMFSSNSIKAEEWNRIVECDFVNDDSLYQDSECSTCLIYNICPTCYGMNFLERGVIGRRDKRLCCFIKEEKKALAKYLLYKIKNKGIGDLDEFDYLNLKAITELKSKL